MIDAKSETNELYSATVRLVRGSACVAVLIVWTPPVAPCSVSLKIDATSVGIAQIDVELYIAIAHCAVAGSPSGREPTGSAPPPAVAAGSSIGSARPTAAPRSMSGLAAR